jgi:hypothetical protein
MASVGHHLEHVLLDQRPHVVGQRLEQAGVAPRLGAQLNGRDRLEEPDRELRRKWHRRRDRKRRQPRQPPQQPHTGEHRHRLFGPDDRHRDDRHARTQRRRDPAAAGERTQPVSLRERLRAALAPLGERKHELLFVEQQPVNVRRMAADRADLRQQHPDAGDAGVRALGGELDRTRARVLLGDRLRDHRAVGW